METTRDGNLAFTRVGSLWLVAVGLRSITDDSWREYLERAAEAVRTGGPFLGVLFWAPRHGPSTRQRRMLTHEFGRAVRLDAQRRVALISDSPLVRGATTAITWFTRHNLAAFSSSAVPRALAWLGEEIAFDPARATAALDAIVAAAQGGDVRRSGVA